MQHALVERWLAGWSALRGVPVDDVDGHALVHVNGPSRRTELVCVEPATDELAALLGDLAGDPAAMLTVVSGDRARYTSTTLPSPVRVDRDDETLMHCAALRAEATVLPAEASGRFDAEGSRIRYEVAEGDRLVAWATLGLADGWATFDQVETIRSHRRRGLGRHVMATLTQHAIDQGATQGVLAASADGRALYERIGWQVDAELWSLMGA